MAVEAVSGQHPLDGGVAVGRTLRQPGDEVRLFLTENGYRQALDTQRSQQIKIKAPCPRCRGHIIDFKRRKSAATRKPPPTRNELCVPLRTLKKPSANTANPSDMGTEIDRVIWRLPFGTAQDVFTDLLPKAAVFLAQPELPHLTAAVSLKIAAFFMP